MLHRLYGLASWNRFYLISRTLGVEFGAPRILQSLAADRFFPLLWPFAKDAGPAENPKRAILLSGVIAYLTMAMESKVPRSPRDPAGSIRSNLKRFDIYSPNHPVNAWCSSLAHKINKTILKITRMVFPLRRLLMILAPAWPPAKEATAAGRMNFQLISDMEA